MAIIGNLVAFGIVQQAKGSLQFRRDTGYRHTQDWGPGTRAASAADGGGCVRGAIVERHSLRIREDHHRFAAQKRKVLGCFICWMLLFCCFPGSIRSYKGDEVGRQGVLEERNAQR
jgi:hypothetical protein